MTVQLAWLLGKTCGKDPISFVCQVLDPAVEEGNKEPALGLTLKLPFDSVLQFLLLLYSLVEAHRHHVSALLFTSPQLIWEVGQAVDVSETKQEEDH